MSRLTSVTISFKIFILLCTSFLSLSSPDSNLAARSALSSSSAAAVSRGGLGGSISIEVGEDWRGERRGGGERGWKKFDFRGRREREGGGNEGCKWWVEWFWGNI